MNIALGTNEQRTEPYMKYGEGAAEFVTTRYVINTGRVFGSAKGQANVVRGSYV